MRRRVGHVGETSHEEHADTPRRVGYILPLDAVVLVLAEVEQAVLSSSAALQPGKPGEVSHVTLVLRAGAVVTCQIVAPDGRPLLAGEDALQTLRNLGELAWHFSCLGETAPQAAASPPLIRDEAGAFTLVPRRTTSTLPLAQLPTRIRQVLSLVDGARSLAQIAQILHRSTSDVSQILRQAHEAGWIDHA